jgi:hypothetical protein
VPSDLFIAVHRKRLQGESVLTRLNLRNFFFLAHLSHHSQMCHLLVLVPISPPRCRRQQLLLPPPPPPPVAVVRRHQTTPASCTKSPPAPCRSAPMRFVMDNPSFASWARRRGSGIHHSSAPPCHGCLHHFLAAALPPRLLGAPRSWLGLPALLPASAWAAGVAPRTSASCCTLDAPELLSADIALWYSYCSTPIPTPSTSSPRSTMLPQPPLVACAALAL